MTNQEYLSYLKEYKSWSNEVHSRYPLDKDSPEYKLQEARNRIYDRYLDKQIESYELKAMEDMVSRYLKNMQVDVSLDGQKISDAIVKEITKGLKQ